MEELSQKKKRKEALKDLGSRGETYPRKPKKGRLSVKGPQTAPQQREREKASLHPHISGAREKSQISSDIRFLRDKSEFGKTMAQYL